MSSGFSLNSKEGYTSLTLWILACPLLGQFQFLSSVRKRRITFRPEWRTDHKLMKTKILLCITKQKQCYLWVLSHLPLQEKWICCRKKLWNSSSFSLTHQKWRNYCSQPHRSFISFFNICYVFLSYWPSSGNYIHDFKTQSKMHIF